MTLYEIDRRITETLESLIDPETGEITDYSLIDALQMERAAKIEGITLSYKNHMAEANMIKAEIKELTERMKSAAKRAENAARYLEYALNGENFKTSKCEVKFRTTKRVDILDEQGAIAWCLANGHESSIKKELSLGKTEAGNLLKSGVPIPGVKINQYLSMGVK